jgi:hypothetical protein
VLLPAAVINKSRPPIINCKRMQNRVRKRCSRAGLGRCMRALTKLLVAGWRTAPCRLFQFTLRGFDIRKNYSANGHKANVKNNAIRISITHCRLFMNSKFNWRHQPPSSMNQIFDSIPIKCLSQKSRKTVLRLISELKVFQKHNSK